ncbi:pitrilysin family protein [Microcoleus sp. FACHB-68]|uniref:M16 family metallopeptidase n=1 Tax=Microcoleus sp. FACHB-68 TaxID=2692826 RepID=UPI001688FD76|nr:pitrilysin family protein [Microcoleus sp. FACHB-68]MBD1938109.1 insulinase family protein [Microcoleus sp. FACHB-68]
MLQLRTLSGFPAEILRLENGLTVIHQSVPATPVAVVDVWVRAGAMAEPAQWSGMAHFLEHMIFKGTDLMPPGVFDCTIENRGGMTNAATSHDYAHFFTLTAAEYLKDTLPALAELILHAAIPDDEFVRERDVVLEEIRQSADSPDWLAFQALMEIVYPRHPYGRPILGTEAKLMQHSPQEMRSFHRTHYQPENMAVVIVGDVELEPALELVNQAFEKFPVPEKCPKIQIEAEPPMIEIRRRELYVPRLEQARLIMAWTGPGVDQLQDAYGLDLLSVLLGEGRTSRLVRDLREEGRWVQGVNCSFSLQQESSLLTISAWLDPKNVEQVEALICEHLMQLQAKPISEAELARCKRLLCNDYAFSTETPIQLAGLYGYYHTIARSEMSVTYPAKIQSYQAKDLQRLAAQYLSPHYYAVTVLKPL